MVAFLRDKKVGNRDKKVGKGDRKVGNEGRKVGNDGRKVGKFDKKKAVKTEILTAFPKKHFTKWFV